MIKIYNKDTGEFLGRISETDLRFLNDQLEEEGLEDRDYFIREETLETFASAGAPPKLMELLRGGLRGRPAMEIRWERDK